MLRTCLGRRGRNLLLCNIEGRVCQHESPLRIQRDYFKLIMRGVGRRGISETEPCPNSVVGERRAQIQLRPDPVRVPLVRYRWPRTAANGTAARTTTPFVSNSNTEGVGCLLRTQQAPEQSPRLYQDPIQTGSGACSGDCC